MTDYLTLYSKFNDFKDVSDCINEVKKLREYYRSQQYEKMTEHINSLTKKYVLETIIWNSVNQNAPVTYQQAYINAENFMQMQGATVIATKVFNYASRLTKQEQEFIESIIKPME
ncbi:MAG: hypothetical protein HFE40_01635 [Clostridia bacterium]|nr:hypothetical protein [Clostridia bacterium]